ncbi:YphA family membrane protein [Ornithinibacillus bavariensis]|uniref:YphA family membrane protein n=1 Tax=Ornithinibacillus bavariensis TaxID=545502 RepID=UPI000EEC502E|nr:hypothetical protein [Ornithinibacillus sp.]
MDGIFFYWLCWMIWVVVTFLMPKEKTRTMMAVWILLTLTSSNLYISVYNVEVSMAYVCVFLGSILYIKSLKPLSYHLFSAMTIMIGYSSILIWESIAPVWLFMPRLIIIPVLCVLLTLVLTKGLSSRLAISTLGLCGGELLYCILLTNLSMPDIVGELLFLDTLLIVLLLLGSIEIYQIGKNKFFLYLSKVIPKGR